MGRTSVFLILLTLSYAYTLLVYINATNSNQKVAVFQKKEMEQVLKGKMLFQQYNCIACHQVYGLGGYLGPDLTTAWSDKNKGEAYIKAMLLSGNERMPNYHFQPAEVESLLSYLRYVDTTTKTSLSKFPGQ